MQHVSLRVATLQLDPRDGRAVVVLVHGESVFPLWLGDGEARAIASAMQQRGGPSHDPMALTASVIGALGSSVEHVEITGIVGGVATALLSLADATGVVTMPCRVSDAIALAVRAGAPILIHEELLAQIAARVAEAEARAPRPPSSAEPAALSSAERWNQLLAHLSSSGAHKIFEG